MYFLRKKLIENRVDGRKKKQNMKTVFLEHGAKIDQNLDHFQGLSNCSNAVGILRGFRQRISTNKHFEFYVSMDIMPPNHAASNRMRFSDVLSVH